MPTPKEFQRISDQELLLLIKEDQDYLSLVYKKTKDYCIRFMKSMTVDSNIREEELTDIFHDALLIFYEKVIATDFRLTATIQTYLNSVCRFQILNKFKSIKKKTPLEDDGGILKDLQFDPLVDDVFAELKIQDENQYAAIENALKQMQQAGGNCYEILTLFWYHKRSMQQLAEHFGYTNEVNARNQKAKCQKRLKKMANKELISI